MLSDCTEEERNHFLDFWEAWDTDEKVLIEDADDISILDEPKNQFAFRIGFQAKYDMNEKEIVERIKKIAGKHCVEERYEFKDIQAILGDDLMKRFMRKLETTSHEEPKRRAVLDTAIKAMIDSRR